MKLRFKITIAILLTLPVFVLAESRPYTISQGGTGTSTAPTYGKVLVGNGLGGYMYVATSSFSGSGGSGGSGTVTSVGLSVPTGLSISGSPITTSGTLALTLTAGYNIPQNASTTNWNTFYDTPSNRIGDGIGLTWSGNTLNCDTASGSIQGCLTSTDWNTFNGKQAGDSTLTALAAYNTNGLLTQTSADTFTGRTLTGTSNRISVSNGDGVSGNPTVNIDTNYVGQNTITTLGTVATGVWNGTTIALANGGTGQTTANNALNALLPTQTSNSGKYLTTDGSNSSWATVSGSGTVNSGVFGQTAYYGANGTAVSGTSTLVIGTTTTTANNVGIGTTTPTRSKLSIQGGSALLDLAKSDGTSVFNVANNGDLLSTGNITVPSQIQFNSTIFTQFQALYANLNFQALNLNADGHNLISFTTGGTDVLSITPGKVAVGTTTLTHAAGLTVGSGDIFVGTSTGAISGIILQASDASCHKIVVSNVNVITASTVTCP